MLLVVFISEHYAEKVWFQHEMKLIREMIILRKNNGIMFFKLDNSELESLATTDAFIPIQRRKPGEVADMIVNRIIRQHIAVASEIHIPIPPILKDKLFMKYQWPLVKVILTCVITIVILMGILLIHDPRLQLNEAGFIELFVLGASFLAFYIGAFSLVAFFVIYIIRSVTENVEEKRNKLEIEG